MYFVSPVLMEAKEFKNEPLPFVPKEEFSEMKSVIEHICKMMAVCLGEKDCNSLNSGCVTKHKFDYPYALTTVLHLIVKYFRYRFFSYRVSHKIFNPRKNDALFVLHQFGNIHSRQICLKFTKPKRGVALTGHGQFSQ